MTLVLTPPQRRSEHELLRRFHELVTDWGDPACAAGAVVDLLREAVPNALATVFRHEPETESAVVLAASPHPSRSLAVGARVVLRDGLMAAALREGTAQRAIDSYLDPDFTGSGPGAPRSLVVVPFRGDRGGLVRLEYLDGGRPSAADEQTAHSLATLLELGLRTAAPRPAHGAPGDAEREQRTRRILSSAASHLAQSNDLSRSMQRLTESAAELLEREGAVLLLRHTSRSALEVAAVAGPVPLAVGDHASLDGHVLATVVHTAQPRTWTPGAESPPLLDHPGGLPGVRAALAVPLIAGGRAFGALAVLTRSEADHPFGPADLEILQQLADQSAGLESLRLLQPLRQRLSDSSIVAEVGRAVTGTLGIDEVLALVVRSAEMLAGAQGAAVALVDDRGTQLILEAASGSLMRHHGDHLPLHGSLLGWATLRGETVTTPSLADDERATGLERRPGSGVAVPIEARNQVHGVLFAVRSPKHTESPSDEDVDALRKLAAYAAIAIENARLYREQLQLSAALRAQAAELEKAYADLSESQERLVVAEKMAALGRVTAGIAHEINSPLGGILNCLQMSQQYVEEYKSSIGDPDVGPDDHRAIAADLSEALSLAEHSARKVAQFVRTIKNQTRMGDEAQFSTFDPAQEIEGCVALLQHELRNRNVTLHTQVEPGRKLAGDPGKFALVLQNLLTNAIDAYEQKAGEVWVRLRVTDAALLLEVEDRGCGIPEEIRGKIYDYLFTTKDIGQGTGLGLATVHSIVTSHFEGKIDFRSAVGAGTTFTVTFPAPNVRV